MKQFLNKDERDHLATQHRKEKDGRTRDRIKAVLMSDNGWTFKDIAEALLLDQETVSRHVKEYKEQQKLSISTGGSESKLSHLRWQLEERVKKCCLWINISVYYNF